MILTFEPNGVKTRIHKGISIFDAAKKTGLHIRSECGGRTTCGKCKVIAKDSSSVNDVTDEERNFLSSLELKSGYRLACACFAKSDAVVYIPEESRLRTRRFLVEGTERHVLVEPAIRKYFVHLEKPSLQDIKSDAQRLMDAIKENYRTNEVKFNLPLLQALPKILRDSNWKVTVTVWNEKEIVSVEKGNTSGKAFGIAFDIGTSKIIGYLSNLINGELISAESMENPQIMRGEDVISRISYANKSDNSLRELQKQATNSLNTVIFALCKKTGINPHSIYEATVVGNTAMHHFFLGISPKNLGLSPYVPAVSSAINETARNLRLRTNPNANVYLFPIIAGFVGGDAVADVIASGIHESDKLSMVLDIGTNTEIIMGNRRRLIACSCASGPAFEGAHIKCGMKAVEGAIEQLSIDLKNGETKYQTIGQAAPLGLCGSGIIDAVANLLRYRIISKEGAFIKSALSSKRLRKTNNEKEFVLLSKKEGAKRDIVITQRDIREIQLAKAAIYTGCQILMKRKAVKPSDIKNLYIAGAFGNYVNPANAKTIGLFPDIPTESIKFVGNAAGAGARMALISKKLRSDATSISRKTSYVELASEPDFQAEFLSAMSFPHRDTSRFESLRDLP